MFADRARPGKPATRTTSILRADDAGTSGVLNGLMDAPEPAPPEPEVRRAADRTLLATVDGLTDDQLAAPSLLPGWSRAHVVAHLALNGEALAAALTGVAEDRAVPMYPSQDARDADIEELAAASPDVLRARLADATARFADAAVSLPTDRAETRIERVPGGPTFRAGTVPLMRWREVEIHHADLAAGYSPADWSDDFAVALLDSMAHRPWPSPLRLAVSDLDRTWEYGDPTGSSAGADVPTVTGTARDLGWWATGRGSGNRLTTDHETLPEVQGW
jgi:maleylpyruvate isomerase